MADTIEVRAAATTELDRAVDTITLAFAADPFTRWVFPECADFLRWFPVILREFGGHGIAHQCVYVTRDFGGAALWLPPGVHPNDAVFETVIKDGVPAQRQGEFVQVFEQMNGHHPDEPHWYLPMIGVDPSCQSGGRGSALLRHALARVDRDGVHAYLESSNPANIPLYERHGFEVTGRIQVADSPVMTPMLRRPR
jgi:ribosomal protein S18 acetylase RimI-like enzyme